MDVEGLVRDGHRVWASTYENTGAHELLQHNGVADQGKHDTSEQSQHAEGKSAARAKVRKAIAGFSGEGKDSKENDEESKTMWRHSCIVNFRFGMLGCGRNHS